MTQTLVYEERLKSSCQRVQKVLKENGIETTMDKNKVTKQWQVWVNTPQYQQARNIVWGDDNA